MVSVKRIVLDVLKPHQPNVLEFSKALAAVGPDYSVSLVVMEVDENTETLQIEMKGENLNLDEIEAAINMMGGSLHSIDQVDVISRDYEPETEE